MFHDPPEMLKTGLVQLPLDCVLGTRTWAGPPAAPDGADVVVVASDGSVLVVEEATVLVVSEGTVEAAGGGGAEWDAEGDDPDEVPEPWPTNIPTTSETPMAVSSCQFLQDRCSLIDREPGPIGDPPSGIDGAGVVSVEPGEFHGSVGFAWGPESVVIGTCARHRSPRVRSRLKEYRGRPQKSRWSAGRSGRPLAGARRVSGARTAGELFVNRGILISQTP